ncbi:MAG: cupin domain-containing protein [Lewinellaceae bacterium]|nr:cupin domain-containing protein [Saprospiraceae bacterium]MCB9331173.1 cupin domain-containing protein [Lewinellaceae bacterium]
MEIKKNGTQGYFKGPEDWFTGTVRVEPLFGKKEVTKGAGSLVTFEPGARTAWHTHPAGQTLIVQSGLGWVQREGGPIEEIRPGDVVYFEPNEKHWHGASSNAPMSHIAIQEEVNGEVVTWMEHVSDDDYSGKQ